MGSAFAYSHLLLQKARELRKNQTQAEVVLWERLRNRRLGGFKFRRQHVINECIVDFWCHEAQLIIEVDGEAHRHLADQDQQRDMEMLVHGYRTLRFMNYEVQLNPDVVCGKILEMCLQRRGKAHENSKRHQNQIELNSPPTEQVNSPPTPLLCGEGSNVDPHPFPLSVEERGTEGESSRG